MAGKINVTDAQLSSVLNTVEKLAFYGLIAFVVFRPKRDH